MSLARALLVVVFALLMGGCAVSPAPAEALDLSTRTQTPTVTATMTVQWFPASSTPTLRATPTTAPTIDYRPGVVDVLLEDDFSDAAGWSTLQGTDGNIAIANGQISLAVSRPGGSLSSLQSLPLPGDFYLEISAAPSLCKSGDSYGLLLRSGEEGVYYRYAVTCSGLLQVEEVRANRSTVLREWTPSGQVPSGAPARVRLGVWAYGEEMRFFAGDVYQFSLDNLAPQAGRLGVFARSAGTTALTVGFSDLVVYSLGRVPPSPTATITPEPATSTPVP